MLVFFGCYEVVTWVFFTSRYSTVYLLSLIGRTPSLLVFFCLFLFIYFGPVVRSFFFILLTVLIYFFVWFVFMIFISYVIDLSFFLVCESFRLKLFTSFLMVRSSFWYTLMCFHVFISRMFLIPINSVFFSEVYYL